jgi:hypothetical protein
VKSRCRRFIDSEIKALLMYVFPTLAQDEDGRALEEMALNFQAFFKQTAPQQ